MDACKTRYVKCENEQKNVNCFEISMKDTVLVIIYRQEAVL